MHSARVSLGGAAPVDGSVEVTEDAITIAANGTLVLEYADVDDVTTADYVIRITDAAGSVAELSMLGKAYGQIAEDLRVHRNTVLERDLLLRGVNLQDSYPAKLVRDGAEEPVEVRMYEDLLVVVPERGVMFGVPFSFVSSVSFDASSYRVTVSTDDGEDVVLAKLAKRTEEFRDELQRLLDAADARAARTLGALLPGTPAATIARLARAMRDGRAVQQRAVDSIDAALWPALEKAVTGDETRRTAYEQLRAMTPPGWAAFGVKAVKAEPDAAAADADAEEQPLPADEERAADAAEAAPDEAPAEKTTDLWYFCPLSRDGAPANAAAFEVTSETGHATYVFRLTEPERFASLASDALAEEVARGIARLNRALLLLNFRREPLLASEAEIAPGGRYARYRAALRLLPYLRWARSALIGRAVHNASWLEQVQTLAAK